MAGWQPRVFVISARWCLAASCALCLDMVASRLES